MKKWKKALMMCVVAMLSYDSPVTKLVSIIHVIGSSTGDINKCSQQQKECYVNRNCQKIFPGHLLVLMIICQIISIGLINDNRIDCHVRCNFTTLISPL